MSQGFALGTPTVPLPVSVANGGTGASTLTGIVTGNGTSPMTANAVTQHGVLIGGASNTASSLGVAATGTVLTGVTGSDPAFSATPTVTSIKFGSGSTLSSYTTGTFSPGISFGGGTTGITYSEQSGTYWVIGAIVFVKIQVTLTNKGSSTGNAAITGLPFTSANDAFKITVNISTNNVTYDAGYTWCTANVPANSTTINLIENGSGVANTALTNSNFANNSQILIGSFYFTA